MPQHTILVFCGRRDDYPFRAGVEVHLRLQKPRKGATRFNYDINVHCLPREIHGITLLQERYSLLVNDELTTVSVNLNFFIIPAVNRVVLQKVCEIFKISQIVDCNHLNIFFLEYLFKK